MHCCPPFCGGPYRRQHQRVRRIGGIPARARSNVVQRAHIRWDPRALLRADEMGGGEEEEEEEMEEHHVWAPTDVFLLFEGRKGWTGRGDFKLVCAPSPPFDIQGKRTK